MTHEQTIQRIIDSEIYVNASPMVTDLMNEGSHWVDSLTDCLSVPDYDEAPSGYAIRQNDNGRWEWQEADADDWAGDEDTERDAIIQAWDASGDEPDQQEALQFWLVSDWLADKLEDVGAPVARDVLGFNVWGRTECGQSLTMDDTLYAVASLLK